MSHDTETSIYAIVLELGVLGAFLVPLLLFVGW